MTKKAGHSYERGGRTTCIPRLELQKSFIESDLVLYVNLVVLTIP